MFGTLEERPARDFDDSDESLGATDVVSSERLFEHLRKSHEHRVDTHAYLAARLFDIVVGDRDRHRDQWRWGRFSADKNARWEPIPRDRDMPFAKFEGAGPWAIRGFAQQLVTFGSKYPPMVWLNWNAREIDRKLLVGLSRAEWDSAVRELQTQLSDSVIRAAVGQMPVPFQKLNGAELIAALIARRERLAKAGAEFYELLAREVNVAGTDAADLAQVSRETDGAVRVRLSTRKSSGSGAADSGATYFDRRFLPGETHEVRVHLLGGDDRVAISGARRGDILVRIVGGDGDDVVIDSIPNGDGALRIYDSKGKNRVESASSLSINSRPYSPPAAARAENEARDWGSWSYVMRTVSVSPGAGLLLGVSHTRIGYAFRHEKFSTQSTLRLDASIAERRPRLTWDGLFTQPNSRNIAGLSVVASGIDLIRFHGLGNQTASDRATDYYRVLQNLFRIEPTWRVPLRHHAILEFHAVGQYTSTRDSAQTLVGEMRPYGSGGFGELGVGAGVEIDRRDSPIAPSRGYRVRA
ncbi:MAG: hypothetical protein ABIT38_22610, partial [Gemmatimonadaceae bacterium]